MNAKLELVKRYWEAERARDIEAVLTHFDPDAIFESPVMTARGLDQIREFYQKMDTDFKEVEVSIKDSVEWQGLA
jgi:ketosteroid isomerase-like protein